MNEFFEIAYAATSGRLCLFAGVGFSKAITGDKALSWKELLEQSCNALPNADEMRAALIPRDAKKPLNLEEVAQVLDLELEKIGGTIYGEIAKIISNINLSGDNTVIKKFLKDNSVCIITTNYDKLLEELIGLDECQSVASGIPISDKRSKPIVYHMHGSIDSPLNMVVTTDDYNHCQKSDSYISRKVNSKFHDETIVMLGYSLADVNLKKVINQYQNVSTTRSSYGNLFLVLRGKVDRCLKEYYAHFYGIRILDRTGIHTFFDKTERQMKAAKNTFNSLIDKINKVLFKNQFFDDKYLRLDTSFFEIIATLGEMGEKVNSPNAVKMLGSVIQRKEQLSRMEDGWEQHIHLVGWLCFIASILEFPTLSIRNIFLDATLHSMNAMSRDYYYGHSWLVYRGWNNNWPYLLTPNKDILRNYIREKSKRPDALSLVARD